MNRLTALPVIGSIFVAACAAPPDEVASVPAEQPVSSAPLVAAAEPPADPVASAESAAAAEAAPGEVPVVEVAELKDDGLVCEQRRRSGSRIARPVCTSREALAATKEEQAEAARAYARELDRERALKDSQGRNPQTTNSVIVFQ